MNAPIPSSTLAGIAAATHIILSPRKAAFARVWRTVPADLQAEVDELCREFVILNEGCSPKPQWRTRCEMLHSLATRGREAGREAVQSMFADRRAVLAKLAARAKVTTRRAAFAVVEASPPTQP